jgi:hypothetical protein
MHDLLHWSGGKYTNRYNRKEDEPTLYCTSNRHANRYTTEKIYHTHDLLHYSGVKYTNRYNTKEDEPTLYYTPSRHEHGYTTEEIYHTHDLLHHSGGKYMFQSYYQRPVVPFIYCDIPAVPAYEVTIS